MGRPSVVALLAVLGVAGCCAVENRLLFYPTPSPRLRLPPDSPVKAHKTQYEFKLELDKQATIGSFMSKEGCVCRRRSEDDCVCRQGGAVGRRRMKVG